MSDIAIGRTAVAEAPFRAVGVAVMCVAGIFGFLGMLVLGAYAPDLRSGHNGGGHALSNAAIGYSALVRLVEATGRHPQIIRNEHQFGSEDLLVLTPQLAATNISKPLQARWAKPTLFILPKWQTNEDPEHKGWARRIGLADASEPEGVLAPIYNLRIERRRSGGKPLIDAADVPATIHLSAPRPLQVITGITIDKRAKRDDGKAVDGTLTPIITDGHGGIVVAAIGGGPLYVCADPDIFANLGMKDAQQAQSALALLDYLNSNDATSINFDVTLNGFGHSPSPLKLAFEPPFLAMTLALGTLLLLTGLHALGRFGPAARPERAIALGKSTLVDNSAAMVRRAGREAELGHRYVDMIRERAVAIFGIPTQLRAAELDAYLNGLSNGPRFTDLARDTENAGDRTSLTAAAQALHEWLKERRA